MAAHMTRQVRDSITIEVTLPLRGSMLEAEEAIQDALNEVGLLATEEKLKRFDTDGSPIQVGSVRMTSKGQFWQDYETPYGSVAVARHVYQTSGGGRTFVPLEENARMILNATPKLAKLVSQIRGRRSRRRGRRFVGMPPPKDLQSIRKVAGRYGRRLRRRQRRDLGLYLAEVRAAGRFNCDRR